jgi:hypothetical protein
MKRGTHRLPTEATESHDSWAGSAVWIKLERKIVEIPYVDGLDYGVGYDSLKQSIRGDSVVRTTPEDSLADTGSQLNFSMQMVESHQQLLQALNISASLSLGNAITGGGSGQASFTNTQSIDDYSVYLLANVTVRTAHKRMRDVKLNDDASAYLSSRTNEEFRDRYGDFFVVGVTSGGCYFGLIQIHCEHAEDKTDISAAIRAGGGLGSWSASADFNSAVSKISTQYDMQVYEHQEGGDDLGQAKTVSDIASKAVGFGNSVQSGRQVPYLVELLDYGALPLPSGPNPLDLENQRQVLEQLASYRSNLYDLLGSIQYVLAHQQQFVSPDVNSLNAAANGISADINNVYHAATTCFSDYKVCALLTTMDTPTVALPPTQPGAAGQWQQTVQYQGKPYTSTWTLTPRGGDAYEAKEAGLGAATGTGTLSGNRLTIEWATTNETGQYAWDVGTGSGTLQFTSGSRADGASFPSQIVRVK